MKKKKSVIFTDRAGSIPEENNAGDLGPNEGDAVEPEGDEEQQPGGGCKQCNQQATAKASQ